MASLWTARNTLRSAAQCLRKNTRTRSFCTSRFNAAVYSKADKTTYTKVINDSQSRVVLVDFYADWCQPCRIFSPILEKFASEPNTSANGLPVDLVKIDTESDDGHVLAAEHKVTALPTVFVYKDGKPVTQLTGALPEAHLKKFLDSL
ncbi:thioredoxin-like protein [Macrolepiota fuliginosa MF-IS2]|uniref:Thioredoxin-like protein n=1 Tax=Macrolepiota fuliginosa MF-IS2 TaxID=1400762 RepID=A0A9P5XCN6_9AGAR|nr:thioredoxin-like protein [Macrolepiota fuliginosa MF-IS2]